MSIINPEALRKRAQVLEEHATLNGIKFLRVLTLDPDVQPSRAEMVLHFYNDHIPSQLITNDADTARDYFPITGGQRVPAGRNEGQVRVVEIKDYIVDSVKVETALLLIVEPIGDYSTYTLSVDIQTFDTFDPFFSKIDFKFRPGCFNINCAPQWDAAPEPKTEPVIDYLAKDYDSFKHTLISAMMQRVPGWEATSEADLDQVLIDLFSAAADELSDFQDRAMNEAYLGTARKRLSIERHARLMDYHVHQGNQASTWLALELKTGELLNLPKGFKVWSGNEKSDSSAVVFAVTRDSHWLFNTHTGYAIQLDALNFPLALKNEFIDNDIALSSNITVAIETPGESWSVKDVDNKWIYYIRQGREDLGVFAPNLHHLLNNMALYTWSGAVPALKAGSVSADLLVAEGEEEYADAVLHMMREGWVTHLMLQERRNPCTGKDAGVDTHKRQVVELLPKEKGARKVYDPVGDNYLIRVTWEPGDKLTENYCFTVQCPEGDVPNVSFFNGNLVTVYHGEFKEAVFRDSGEIDRGGYTLFKLPHSYLAYKETPPGGDVPPRSTLEVQVEVGGVADPWDEVVNLVHSGVEAERGDHFMVETDEEGNSRLRFGNGVHGRELPEDAVVRCLYQVGKGTDDKTDGNIGSDKLIYFQDEQNNKTLTGRIKSIWNPFHITNGRPPEPVAEIIRRVPEAYRERQKRAVTLADYKQCVEELEGVSRAAAQYAWTGSWRTVRIAVDPKDTTTLEQSLLDKIHRHLEAVRLIGEDVEIRPPRFVPLEIKVLLCIRPQFSPTDIIYILEQEFSDGYLPDGRAGFFHPDNWTFGQFIRASQVIGRAQAVQGVHHVMRLGMRRWDTGGPWHREILDIKPMEIILVQNNPNHMEKGSITFYTDEEAYNAR